MSLDDAADERFGGLFYNHQYTMTGRLAFQCDRDREAHDFIQRLLLELDEAMVNCGYSSRRTGQYSEPPCLIAYGFDGAYTVTNPDGSERQMSFLATDERAQGKRSTYALELTIDLEADDDAGARERVRDVTKRMVVCMMQVQFRGYGVSIEPRSLVGREYDDRTRDVGLYGALENRTGADREHVDTIDMEL